MKHWEKIRNAELLQVGLVLLSYPWIHWLISRGAWLNEQAYHQPSITLEAVSFPYFQLAFLASVLPYLVFRKKFAWDSFDETKRLRLLITLVALIVAWPFSTQDYNYYYDQWHLVDRLLLVFFALGVYVTPACIPCIALWSVMFVHQVDLPIGPTDHADKRMIFEALILFHTVMLWRVLLNVRSHTIVYTVACLVAVNYYYPGLLKYKISPTGTEWILHNELGSLIIASYINGWQWYIPKDLVIGLVNTLAVVNVLITTMVMIFEAGSALGLLTRRVFLTFCIFHILLHVGIGVLSGVCFWKWVLLNAALFWYVWRAPAEESKLLFAPKLALVSVPIVMFSLQVFQPVPLGWYDTRIMNFFKLYATDETGKEHEFPAAFFAPYDIIFQQTKFYYLKELQPLTLVYGGVGRFEIAEAIKNAGPGPALDALKRRYGIRYKNPERREAFKKFVVQYVKNYEAGKFESHPLWRYTLFLRGPQHIHTSARIPTYEGQFEVHDVVVRYHEAYFTGDDIVLRKADEVLRLPIRAAGDQNLSQQVGDQPDREDQDREQNTADQQ